jgi:flagellum-specific peptidoglycan hydrolase FlgJ
MQTLDENGRAKAFAALAEANAKGGKGAAEALQAQLMGLPPMTKAAQEFTAIAPKMAAANNKMAAAVKDGTDGLATVKRASNELGVAARDTSDAYGQGMDAIIMGGGTLASTMATIKGTSNQMVSQGIKTVADAENQRQSIEARQKQREESQAATMSDASRAMKELYDAVMEVVNPMVQILTPVIDLVTLALKALMFAVKPAITPFIWIAQILGFLIEKLKSFLNLFGGEFKEKEPQLKSSAKEKSSNVSAGNDLRKKPEVALANSPESSNKGVFESLQDSLMRLPPMTKAAQEFSVTAPDVMSNIKNQANSNRDQGSVLPSIFSGAMDSVKGAITGGVAGALVGGPIGALSGALGGLLIGENRIGNISKSIGETINNLFVKQAEKEAGSKKTEDTLPEVGTSTDQEIIASLRTMAAESEKSRKLQERSVRHLDDINSNVDNSGPPSFYR